MYLATRVVYELGESLAKSIKQWELDLNRTRIIGFSVGAHIGECSICYQNNVTLHLIGKLFCFFSGYHWNIFESIVRRATSTN